MKVKIVVLILVIVLISAGVIGFYFYSNQKKALTFILPDLNEISYLKCKILGDTAYVQMQGVIENKSPYQFDITMVKYEIGLENKTIIKEQENLSIHLKSREKDTLWLKFRVPMKHAKEIISSLHGKDSTWLTVKAKFFYETIFGSTALEIPFEKKIKVPIPPKINILNVQREKIQLFKKQVKVNVLVEIVNRGNVIDLELNNFRYQVYFGKDIWGEGRYPQKIKVKPGSSVKLKMQVMMHSRHPLKTIMQLMKDKDVMPYSIFIYASLEGFGMYDVPIELQATGMTELMSD